MEVNMISNISSWLIPLLTGIAGALIGTFCGAFFLNKFQNSDKQKIQKIAIRALEIFKSYKGKSFAEAQSEFNNKLTLSEKRAIIVALHKLGLPIKTPYSYPFNINEVEFSHQIISAEYVDDIITQLKNGLCDNLFFQDVEDHFSANLRLMSLRKLAQRYVKKVFSQSTLIQSTNMIQYKPDWYKEFSPGELESIMVFRDKIATPLYFNNIDEHPDSTKLSILSREIEIGLWDSYLFWDYSSYQNVKNQNYMVSLMTQLVNINNTNQEQSITPNPKIPDNDH